MTDEPTPEHLEQLARSVAMSGVLGDRDRLDVGVAQRRLAEIDKDTAAPVERLRFISPMGSLVKQPYVSLTISSSGTMVARADP